MFVIDNNPSQSPARNKKSEENVCEKSDENGLG